MNSRRLLISTVLLGQAFVFTCWAVVRIASFEPAGIENTGPASIADSRPALSPGSEAGFAPAPQAPAVDITALDITEPVTATDKMTGSDEKEPIAETARTDSSQVQQIETKMLEAAAAGRPDPAPDSANETVGSIEVMDECFVTDVCVDRYLWALYQRTPKEDTIKVTDRKKVSVKRRGKTVKVMKTFVRLVDENFTWKDPKAADKAGMPMVDYVIGGMDREFKLKLFHALHAAEQAGLSPGITSAFRDDYRQSIASGLKAATDRSYHGGSFRGGYGHGLAADVVSVKGGTRAQRLVSTEGLWKWIDGHENEFGVGRPYLDKDPPHLAPIDGKEYADHRPPTKPQDTASDPKSRNAKIARDDHNVKRVANADSRN
jgi:hypothetical protein